MILNQLLKSSLIRLKIHQDLVYERYLKQYYPIIMEHKNFGKRYRRQILTKIKFVYLFKTQFNMKNINWSQEKNYMGKTTKNLSRI